MTRILCTALLASVSLVAAAQDDSLVGLWSYRMDGAQPSEIELTLQRRSNAWRATLGGMTVAFKPKGSDIEVAFPDDRGRFRGALTGDGSTIRGFWIRPAMKDDPRYPVGASQAYATPLLLERSGKDRWRGRVRPLPNPFTLYLRIFRNETGELTGAFRNHELNSNGRASRFRVTQDGGTVRFAAGPDLAAPRVLIEATRLSSPDRLRLDWDDLERPIELTRRTPEEAAAYFPRPPGSAAYAYAPPPQTGDGWQTARAASVGLDEAALARMVQEIADADPASARPQLMHSLLVAHRGRLVLEEYFFGYGRDVPHDLRSAGKTFSSVLLGAAMLHGTPIGPDTRVLELMSARGPAGLPDQRKARVTLAQLMTHTAGLACDDNDDASPGNEGNLQAQRAQPDWWKYTLDLPMAHEPGARYAYCSANINLVGGALTVATGTWLPEQFETRIARPLQFGEYYWNLMPNGEGYLGGGAFLRPRDLLKIGQVFLDGGVWQGRRIISDDWVRESTAARVDITPETTGLTPERFSESYFGGRDGYAWHLIAVRAGTRSYESYYASGNGGQLLYVIPELELAVVFTGGNYRQGGIWGRWADRFIGGHLIPAMRSAD